MQALGFLLELAPDPHSKFQQEEKLLSMPVHPDARALHAFWKERKGFLVVGEDIPSRRLARHLPHLALFDYRPARNDFRIRLAGFALIRRFGRDVSRHNLAEVLSGEDYERCRCALMEVRDSGKPLFVDVRLRMADKPLLHFEMQALRVLAADRLTPLVLMGLFYYNAQKRTRLNA